uniref:Exonuclease domain-containing protein n=1 Tax=Polytomella parva TaxID=51329 RepID=A0A7S0YR66_9CHLO|mmetsp:Transcript_33292/g.60174  ORF Transcript_33292/g.60174 Transcript_33292/m.60174 type:complete len:221 (+) Transcript_33292:103-765(+)|eukprot:CAMPEP_0175059230 /NCGR_PEP_ID=MMETSP0052_2-20121109/12313_1 /TAXON_ID=51329 ORGANISM="Polytomella parva, Strain SAG 63-3" /NCGR_SAMPLE_ID=MMETSP0052_2 /ASSEMBLY_ACC=CAM_ASM_000194 /LENGTH=220 /DNA_ID=CAMNT_0016324749 /DNA_START=94 /DNA_END=756 /DNA_ORIENTATION=-
MSLVNSNFYSIDVECVADGITHNHRSIAHIAVVDQFCNVLLDAYVTQEKPVVSYITPLTGLTKEILDVKGIPLQEALAKVKYILPKNCILVGQSIQNDVKWLQLKEGVNFASMIDLQGLYRIWNDKYKSYSSFGQDHVAKVLLNWNADGQPHNAVTDAQKSMKLFHHFNYLKQDSNELQLNLRKLLEFPVIPSFARRFPQFEGVCMGNRKQCSCGAPFFA